MADIRPQSPSKSRTAAAERTGKATGPIRIVGIGAGAGGLEAIQQLFAAMPDDRNLAFVICRQEDPDLADPIGELLGQQTAMPIHQAADGTVLEGNSIYLIPPTARMILLKDRLISFDEDEDGLAVSPLDLFLHALAASAGPEVIAIVLSGAGQEGLRGAVSIHRAGGLVLAQSPESAGFATMPGQVIGAGLASAIAPPGAMADLIQRHLGKREGRSGDAPDVLADEAALGRIFALLKNRFGIDLDAYRPSMVAGRIRRRSAKFGAGALDRYADLLTDDDVELERLHDDLLIGVTAFFRDPDAFAALDDKALPALVEGMSAERPIRIWVPACATGEEAYSLAMLFYQRITEANKPCHLEIIASDRNRRSLEQARLGRYRRERVQGLPSALIGRYALDQGDYLQICTGIRDLLTFVEHDLLQAPAPDDMDLVSCRNLLIYLAEESREKALHACRDALRPDGVLFLGPSELPGPLLTGLAPVQGKWRIYRKAALAVPTSALQQLSRLRTGRPGETILPPIDRRPAVAPPSDTSEREQPDTTGDMLDHNQHMLESTIDTLLASNDALRRRNQDLRTENQHLATAHAGLDDVATMVAHDLKAPLRAVDHLAARIESHLDQPDQRKDAKTDVQQLRHRLSCFQRLIDDLLDYARQDASEGRTIQDVDIGDLLRDALTLIGLPPGFKIKMSPPALRVRTARSPLECVLRNLLGNVFDHHGGSTGTVRIDVAVVDQALDVRLIDDGRGQAGRQEGLGLAIIRQLLASEGAHLSLAPSPDGQGTEAHFTWPIEAEANV